MNLLETLLWRFKGRASEIVVTDFEDSIDAVTLPGFGFGLGAAALYAAVSLYGTGTLASMLAVVVLGTVGIMSVWLGVLATAAAVVYAREATELPADAEGMHE